MCDIREIGRVCNVPRERYIRVADWPLPPRASSTPQGPNYNQTHHIQAHHWATNTNKGNALISN